MEQRIYNRLAEMIPQKRIRFEEPMKEHTTFRIGGPAEVFVMPKDAGEVQAVTAFCRKEQIPYYVLGNGSNLLVSDKGVRGVVVQIGREMQKICVDKEVVTAQAGALLSSIAGRALGEGLAGFEFAAGIPGSLGGACVMNAGAYGGEMKDVIRTVTVLTPKGRILTIPGEQMEFGYRTSIVAGKAYIVLEAQIQLRRGNREEIKAVMDDLSKRRISKQPLEYPSAGSTFKRPEGYFAGKLIQDAGLGGFTLGGAQVSKKHCGFVINRGGATAADVTELMRRVSDTVEERFGVRLTPEVKRLGEF